MTIKMISNEKRKKYISNTLGIMCALFIGAIAFIALYGITPLYVSNDSWIMSSYDESDIIQHYAGWIGFRNSKWNFPLGLADNIAYKSGTIISFTDSIPWVAILFKLFNSYLPDTFQFFGIYTLLCYILQSFSSYLIVEYKTRNKLFSLLSSVLFAFSPILIERAFRHTALGSQWLILFAIYIYLKHYDKPELLNHGYNLILLVLSIGIHPYFLPLVACFALLCVIQDIRNREYRSIIIFPIELIITYFAGYVIGTLGSGVNISREGYGYFSMNLNAIINPSSVGEYTWSSIIKKYPQILGNYDGFNYLGFGIIVGLIITFTLIFGLSSYKNIIDTIKLHWPLICVCVFLTCFAISNVVTLNNRVLFTIPLPGIIINLCSIFRASSRMFYAVYYLIFLSVILSLWKYKDKLKKHMSYVFLVLIIVIQLIDIKSCIKEKHIQMEEKRNFISIMEDITLKKVAERSKVLLGEDISWGGTRISSAWALQNGLYTTFSIANSGDYVKAYKYQTDVLSQIKTEQNFDKYVYVTSDADLINDFLTIPDLQIYVYDDLYFLFKTIDNKSIS